MRILYVSLPPPGKWAGGVPQYTYGLAESLSKLGHEVLYLYNWGADFRVKPYSREIPDGNITFLEVRNSSVHHTNYHNVLLDVTNRKAEKIFAQILERYKPELIHIQNIMGFPFRIIEIAHSSEIPVINSLHNYFYLCPKVELFTNGSPCQGPNEFKCAECIRAKKPTWMKFKILAKTILPPSTLKRAQTIKKKLYRSSNRVSKSNAPLKLRSKSLLSSARKIQWRLEYGKYVLSTCVDCNIAVSNRVANIFINYAYQEDNFLVLHIGTKAAEFIKPESSRRENEELRFGYAGPIAYHKGVHILVEAFKKIRKTDVHLEIYGPIDSQYAQELIHASEGDKRVTFHGKYRYENLASILGSFDVAIISPIWEDNAPQVVFEALAARKPVIGAHIGGIPDFIQHDVNGLLFEAGDINDLSEKIRMMINEPERIKRYRQHIPKMKAMKEHAEEMLQLYDKSLRKRKVS